MGVIVYTSLLDLSYCALFQRWIQMDFVQMLCQSFREGLYETSFLDLLQIRDPTALRLWTKPCYGLADRDNIAPWFEDLLIHGVERIQSDSPDRTQAL